MQMKKLISILLMLGVLLSLFCAGTATAFAETGADAEKVLSEIKGNEYVNEFLGIRASFPADWSVMDAGEAAQLLGYAAEQLDNEALTELLNSSGVISDMYALRGDQSGDNVNIQFEDLGKLYGKLLSETSYLDIAMPKLEDSFGQIGFALREKEVGEYDFAGDTHMSVRITGSYNGIDCYERIVVLKQGNYIASVSAFSLDEQRLEDIFALFEPLQSDVEAEQALGETQGNSYASELLGIRASFSDSWYVLSPEETVQVMGIVADGVGEGALADQLREAGSTCDLYAVALDESGDNVNIQLEDLGALTGFLLTPKQYAEAALPQLSSALEQAGFRNIAIETEDYEFAGRSRVSFLLTGEVNGVPVYERMVLVKSGRYMATVTAFSMQAERLDSILAFFEEN